MNNTAKILLIDDDTELVKIVKLALPPNVELDSVTNEDEAVNFILIKNYDIILVDIYLGDASGFELLEKLKKNNMAVDATKIMLTASKDIEDEVGSHKNEVDDFVQKPIRPPVFEALIEKHLKKRQQSDIWSRGSLLIDVNKMKVTGKNQNGVTEDIVLTPKEFKILIQLIRHPGQVFSREQIFEDVWREEDESYLRSVDTHVSGLRKKIVNYGANLNSVRGIGYKIEFL